MNGRAPAVCLKGKRNQSIRFENEIALFISNHEYSIQKLEGIMFHYAWGSAAL
jgi:hypothetical protein